MAREASKDEQARVAWYAYRLLMAESFRQQKALEGVKHVKSALPREARGAAGGKLGN